MKDPRALPILLAFFAGSWLSNGHVIRSTGALLEQGSLTLILAVSSLAGLGFYALLRFLDRWQRGNLAAFFMLPGWLLLLTLPSLFPSWPVWPALLALLVGEVVKWHLYSQVLAAWGPMGASRMLGWAVLAYELGTVLAALFPSPFPTGVSWAVEAAAMLALHLPFFLSQPEETEIPARHASEVPTHGPWDSVLPWLALTGLAAGFLKVSADTGFKYAVRLEGGDPTGTVAHFYLLSAGFTLGLGLLRRLRWMAPRMGCPQASFKGLAGVQALFALALLTGSAPFLVAAAALQRSVDKIFYQPNVQLLASGFPLRAQERLRRWHVTGFLAFGSLVGLVAFAGHGVLPSPQSTLVGIALLHVAGAAGFLVLAKHLVGVTVKSLDGETRRNGAATSRPMAMLALLSPRHFLVHALKFSHKGGMGALPQDLLEGLVAEPGREVVRTFYDAFPRLDEQHQMALIRLAAFLDRGTDREFLMEIAMEHLPSSRRARRLAAHQLVKVLGVSARPLLRRARGKNSPLPKKAA